MKRSLVVRIALPIALVSDVVCGADVFVGAYETVTNDATTACVEQVGRVGLAPDGRLIKTGAGEWRVPTASVVQQGDFNVTVAEGVVSFDATAAGAANPVPTVLQEKAAYWVSALDDEASHLVKDGDGGLSLWYDVREAEDVSAPRYYFARALDTYTAVLPKAVEKDGVKAVYFGGLGSGVAMRFGTTSDAAPVLQPYHLFAVVGTYETQGAVFGSGSNGGNLFMYKLAGLTGVPYADTSRKWHQTLRALTYVDGRRFDPYLETPPVGRFHLFDTSSPAKASAGALFAQWTSKQYWGGDYLAEAIAFTNRLTAAEVVEVRNYLAKKYVSASVVLKNIVLDAAGAFKAKTEAGDVATTDVALAGDGTVSKSGGNVWMYRNGDVVGEGAARFEGSLAAFEGAVDLSSQLPIAAASGTKLTAVASAGGHRRVTMASATPGSLVKDGTEAATVASVPPDVTSVKVEAGELQVVAVRTNACRYGNTYYIPIENADFENYFTEAELGAAGGVTGITSQSTCTYERGWRRQTNAAWVFDWTKWTGKNNVSGATRTAYNQTDAPINGKVAVMLHQNTLLATPVVIPESGVYELSLDVYSRASDGYLGSYVKVGLYDVSGGPTGVLKYDFGRAYYYEHNYRRIALRTTVTTPGAYELRIRSCNITGKCMVVDNFALRRTADAETESGVWSVPGGDFEFDRDVFSTTNFDMIVNSPYSNWTFTQGSGLAGVVTLATRNGTDASAYQAECNETRGPYGGGRQLLLAKDVCSVSAECTPPAGTYYLRADLARYHYLAGELTASVCIGGGPAVSLGKVKVENTLMAPYTWDVPFSVSGGQSVVLTLSFSRSDGSASASTGVNVDDVRLVTFADRELIDNGGFETPMTGVPNWAKNWTHLTNRVAACQVQPYSYLPEVFSSDRVDRNFFLYVERDSGAMQEVDFGVAGLYRLSFYAALSRRAYAPDGGHYKHCTPVRAWIAKGGVTNLIGDTGTFANTNFCQYVWDFRVKEPGRYVFCLQGTYTGVYGYNACIDAVSVRPVDESRQVAVADMPFPAGTAVTVASGARLHVDFTGTNTVRRLKLGGTLLEGIVDVKDFPDYLCGSGVFKIEPTGTVLILR